jgi:hypothetical protein
MAVHKYNELHTGIYNHRNFIRLCGLFTPLFEISINFCNLW